jgi:hypothetical protein
MFLEDTKMSVSSKHVRRAQESKYQVREMSEYIIAHQGICHGQPTFRGTRVGE